MMLHYLNVLSLISDSYNLGEYSMYVRMYVVDTYVVYLFKRINW